MVRKNKGANTREQRNAHWGWLGRVLVLPRSTVKKVAAEEKAVWLTPLLVLSIMVIIVVVFSAPIKRLNIQTGAVLPDGFEYWSQDMQQQYLQAQQNMTSATFMYLFPILSGLAGVWLVWLLFSSLLYLSLTLSGSRAPRVKSSNLVAWAMTPLILRKIVEFAWILTHKTLPPETALANLLPSDAEGLLALARGMLLQIDAYWVWFVVILLLGAPAISNLKASKAVMAALITLLIMLLLQGVPNLISASLSGFEGATGGLWF